MRTYKNPLSKGLESQSLRESINAHCYMCMGGEKEGATSNLVVRSIRECSSEICPLRSVRPYQE